MRQFMQTFKFIIAFLVLTIIINMVFGHKMGTRFLQITLLSIVVLNSNKIAEWLERVQPFTIKEEE